MISFDLIAIILILYLTFVSNEIFSIRTNKPTNSQRKRIVNQAPISLQGIKLKSKSKMEGKIIGGQAIPLEAVPYSVQIFNFGAMCSGSILNTWTVLTAAHCFDLNKDVKEILVKIGSRYVHDFSAAQYYASHIVVHNKYNQSGLFACDIALLFLETPIEFSNKSQKIVLATDNAWMNPNERNFTVTGWGWTQYGGPISEHGLMMTHLRFIPNDKCEKLHQLTLSPDMFCLYGEGARDTCRGDSGGGVFWHGMIVGITSHGDGCAKLHKPSIFTNVPYFTKWIKKEMFKYVKTYCRVSTSPSESIDADYYDNLRNIPV